MRELDVAKEAANRGGEIVARYFEEGVTMRNKETYNLVSDADVESEQAIAAAIKHHYPDHAILGEESHHAEVGHEHLWVIDPLDGTNNFAHAIPHFAISVAYYRAGEPVCGVVFNPIRKDWFVTARGQGSFHNGRRAQVGRQKHLKEVLIGVGFYYDRGAMMEATLMAVRDLFRQHIHGIRRFGTASLDLCQVGVGMFGGFFEFELSPWDFAAGRLFLEEAGGHVTDCLGNPVPLGKSSMIASNGHLHAAMLEVISPHFRGLQK